MTEVETLTVIVNVAVVDKVVAEIAEAVADKVVVETVAVAEIARADKVAVDAGKK